MSVRLPIVEAKHPRILRRRKDLFRLMISKVPACGQLAPLFLSCGDPGDSPR